MNKEEVQEKVLQELRAKEIKLWLPPFVVHDDESKTHRAAANVEEIEQLASSLMESSSLSDCTNKDDVIAALVHWQVHALAKLENKKKQHSIACLEVKVLGLGRDVVPHDTTTTTTTQSWAERMELSQKSIKLYNVSPKLTIGKFVEQLESLLQVTSVRLSHKGKSITTTTANNNDARLVQTLFPSTQVASKSGGYKTTILCQVTGDVQESSSTTEQHLSPEQVKIQSIRQAATKLSGSSNFEVTDQNGQYVSMLPVERHAFLTALGLASLGRIHMPDGEYESALVFLLEADQEWNSISREWRNRVDNYGFLQLDIAWTFLQLEKSERLSDATRRLEIAESVLLKQVNPNFVTLAYTMADLGKPVPPLAAVFCRLYLLQGVAYHYANSPKKSKEKLDWAYTVCSSLKSVSSPEAVSTLCEAMPGIAVSQAISALRRTNGNPNQAVELLEKDEASAVEQREKRQEQRQLGLCQNTMNYVNPDLIPKLQNVLDIPSPRGVAALIASHETTEQRNRQVAVGLLRLANNSLEKAIDIYQDVERSSEAVLQRVSQLDYNLAKQGLETPKQGRKRPHEAVAVDEMALARLISMGVEEPDAKRALRASQNNIDASLVWLTRKDDEATAQNGEDVTMEDGGSVAGDGSMSEATSRNEVESNAANTRLEQKRLEIAEATDLLQRELGEALQERDMEKEYLGSSLDEEWEYLEKFVGNKGEDKK